MQFIAGAAIFGFRLGCENGGHQLEKERLPLRGIIIGAARRLLWLAGTGDPQLLSGTGGKDIFPGAEGSCSQVSNLCSL
jgi:hypothetical protein